MKDLQEFYEEYNADWIDYVPKFEDLSEENIKHWEKCSPFAFWKLHKAWDEFKSELKKAFMKVAESIEKLFN